MVKYVPNFERYLSEIYGESTSVSREVTQQLMNVDPNVSSLRTTVMEYLKNRIENGEC